MKRRFAAVLACISILAALGGCDSILEDETMSVTAHQEPVNTESESTIVAGTFDELKADIHDLISHYEDMGEIRVTSYEGDIEKDVPLACSQIMSDDPIGAFAVSDITGEAVPIVSYYQVKINITYKVTKEQLDGIIPVPTSRYLQSDLQDVLSEYEPSTVVQERDIVLTEESALNYVRDVYYENPREIVMLPVTTVDFFPLHAPDRIIKFTFVYTRYEASTLRAMEISLNKAVQSIAESVSGDDPEVLLSFCKRLTDTVEYDTKTAESGVYSDQNIAATAYGALVNGSAVGEGYAMAFKALCDKLNIGCDVVLGEMNGKNHAWNIVELENYYYHIDVSMCDTNGIETAFLRNDTQMAETYTWDTTKYKSCNGPLTYGEVATSIQANASTT